MSNNIYSSPAKITKTNFDESIAFSRLRNIRSYATWESAHLMHLLALRDIFASGILALYSILDLEEYLYSDEFLKEFGRMVYNNSSKRI